MNEEGFGLDIGHARMLVTGRAIWIAAFISFGLTVGLAMLAGAMLMKITACS